MNSIMLLIFYCTFLTSQEYVVIVNKSNPLSSVSPELIKRIYLGKTTKWSFGVRISPIDHPPKSEERKVFSEILLEKDVKKILKFWLKEVIRGNGKPPRMLTETKSILNAVKSSPGAISYIRKKDLTNEVKALLEFKLE